MNLDELKNHLDARLNAIEDKIDNHLERIAKAETSIEWIRGSVKVASSLFITALVGAVSALYNLIIK